MSLRSTVLRSLIILLIVFLFFFTGRVLFAFGISSAKLLSIQKIMLIFFLIIVGIFSFFKKHDKRYEYIDKFVSILSFLVAVFLALK